MAGYDRCYSFRINIAKVVVYQNIATRTYKRGGFNGSAQHCPAA